MFILMKGWPLRTVASVPMGARRSRLRIHSSLVTERSLRRTSARADMGYSGDMALLLSRQLILHRIGVDVRPVQLHVSVWRRQWAKAELLVESVGIARD